MKAMRWLLEEVRIWVDEEGQEMRSRSKYAVARFLENFGEQRDVAQLEQWTDSPGMEVAMVIVPTIRRMKARLAGGGEETEQVGDAVQALASTSNGSPNNLRDWVVKKALWIGIVFVVAMGLGGFLWRRRKSV